MEDCWANQLTGSRESVCKGGLRSLKNKFTNYKLFQQGIDSQLLLLELQMLPKKTLNVVATF